MATPINFFVLKCRNIFPTRNGQNRTLITGPTKILAPSQTVTAALIAPKSARASPQHLVHSVPDFIQIGSFSAEL